jgi:predicted Rossmann fold nucleotide-binding protein DprA/Smf involved in DNA uptake
LKELNVERLKAQTELASKLKGAPRCAPGRQDPYRVFASFATQMIGPATVVSRSQIPWNTSAWETLMKDPLFAYAQNFLPKAQHVQRALHHLSNDNLSIAELAEKIHLPVAPVMKWIASMAKLGLVSLAAEPSKNAAFT